MNSKGRSLLTRMAPPIMFTSLATTTFSARPTYVGGWGMQVNYSSYMFPQNATRLPGYGAAFKQRVRKMQPGYLQLGSFAKVTADQQNYVTVDPGRLDAHGIPTPVVHFRFSDNDRALWQAANQSMLEIFSHLKGKVFPSFGKGPLRLCKPRSGDGSHGQRSPHVGAQQLLPGTRRKKPFRHRRELLHYFQ